MDKLILFLTLLGLWFLISGFFEPLFIFYGFTSSLISVYFFSKMLDASKEEKLEVKGKYFSLKFLSYLVWLSKEIVVSSFNVAVQMWKPNPDTKPYLKWVKHKLKKDASLTVYANSITLTPGTISMYTKDKEILVHALHENGIKDLESGKMHDKIKNSLEA